MNEAEKIASAKEYARQALGDAKAEGITPPPDRPHKPSEHVEALREQIPVAPPLETEPTEECV